MKIKKYSANKITFSLKLISRHNNEYSLALYQRLKENGKNRLYKLVELKGLPLDLAMEQVQAALKGNGHRLSFTAQHERQLFHLGEEAGVRLGLLFLAVKPLSKKTRIEAIAEALRGMAREEVYYWFSKCRAKDSGARACHALRVLLVKE